MVSTIALANAKADLSAVVKNVSQGKGEYIITVRGEPQAMIVPIPKEVPKVLKAKGILKNKKPLRTRDAEKEAYVKTLEVKYANPS